MAAMGCREGFAPFNHRMTIGIRKNEHFMSMMMTVARIYQEYVNSGQRSVACENCRYLQVIQECNCQDGNPSMKRNTASNWISIQYSIIKQYAAYTAFHEVL